MLRDLRAELLTHTLDTSWSNSGGSEESTVYLL